MTFPIKTPYDALQGILLALAVWFIGVFLVIAVCALIYPFPLEWMEGLVVDAIQRVRHLQSLYIPPSLAYVPMMYPPLYYYLSASLSLATGVDYLPARMISAFSALGIAAVLGAWVRRDTGRWQHGLAAAGLFMATYPLSGGWFDYARNDTLALLLTLSGLYVFFHDRTRKRAILAAALLTAAFYTNQFTLLIALPSLAAGCYTDARHSRITAGWLFLGIGSLYIIAQMLSSGWFGFYIVTVPSGHALDDKFFEKFWLEDLLWPLGIACLLAASLFWNLWKRDKTRLCVYAGVAAGLIGTSYFLRLHAGSGSNSLMPAHAALALLAGLGLPVIDHAQKPSNRYFGILLLLFQMGWLLYKPVGFIPGHQAVEAGNHFLREIEAIPGDVFIPDLQFVQTRAGKTSYDFGGAAFDLLRSDFNDQDDIRQTLRDELKAMIEEQKFDAVMPGRLFRLPEKKDLYVFDRNIDNSDEYVGGAFNFPRRVFTRARTSRRDGP